MKNLYSLKLVEQAPFYEREININTSIEAHSLQYSYNYNNSTNPEVAKYLIETFSSPAQVVLDPFCGSSNILFEAVKLGRVVFGSDINPVAVHVSSAKVMPADIAEVTLWLQMLNLKRPVDLSEYNLYFRPFYDANTFRELVHLKNVLELRQDRVTEFVKMLTLSILHGNSSSYLSVSTSSTTCLSPSEQSELNARKAQSPDYRAIIPRLIKRAAAVTVDGLNSALTSQSKKKIVQADARNLNYLSSNFVDLIVTEPPEDESHSQWIEEWFLGQKTINQNEDYSEFMNTCLLEMARVLLPGGRAVLILNNKRYKQIYDIINQNLNKFFDCESVIINNSSQNVIKKAPQGKNHYLVLRRK